ncbi:hypothetical protein ACZ90_37570 [Streptomyces albus subsp. albus]|nr:hypothetical protein ACZ90_37570 [Streptomyces albus subsp. albus]
MKRLSKAVILTATAGATVLGAAGGALAHDGGHGHHGKKHQAKHQTTKHSSSGAVAKGAAVKSPGIVSGNVVQVPIHIPINLCGNTISVVGVLNGAAGNVCVNH